MQNLAKGSYFGEHFQKSILNDLIITDTQYTHKQVDWHRHENPYFTYLLQGKLFEASKKQEHYLTSGGLLFHHWQDSHYNTKPDEFTRGFHVELNRQWFKRHDLSFDCIEGSHLIDNPQIKSFMNLIFMESKINDCQSQLSIDGLMLTTFDKLSNDMEDHTTKPPDWITRLNELFLDTNENYSLSSLSLELGIHPVHISREFNRYFGITFGQYIRFNRANKAFRLLLNSHLNMTEICYECGFYDQSHFIRDFKRIYKQTPSKILKMLN